MKLAEKETENLYLDVDSARVVVEEMEEKLENEKRSQKKVKRKSRNKWY